MAFFKFKKIDENQVKKKISTPESIDVLRARARNRLIGAVILVLIAVIGFPLIFSQQLRPLPNDVKITIPAETDFRSVKSDTLSQTVQQRGGLIQTSESEPAPAPMNSSMEQAAITTFAPKSIAPLKITENNKKESEKIASAHSNASDIVDPVQKKDIDNKIVKTKSSVTKTESENVLAILNGHTPVSQNHEIKTAASKSTKRYIVQIGVFSTKEKVHEIRAKLEQAGFTSYTQEIKMTKGLRIRVRIGPIDSAASAEKISAKVHELGLKSNILILQGL
jgi:DedD protein